MARPGQAGISCPRRRRKKPCRRCSAFLPTDPEGEVPVTVPPDLPPEASEPLAAIRPPRLGPLARLRNYFLAGIIVTAPIGLTIYLVVITICIGRAHG